MTPESGEGKKPFDLNKLSGLQVLQAAGFNVPPIFSSWRSAYNYLKNQGSVDDMRPTSDVYVRGYVEQWDNLLIDMMDTGILYGYYGYADCGKSYRGYLRNNRKRLADPGVINYCQEMGVDPKTLRAHTFLQAAAFSNDEITYKLITLEEPNGVRVEMSFGNNAYQGSYFSRQNLNDEKFAQELAVRPDNRFTVLYNAARQLYAVKGVIGRYIPDRLQLEQIASYEGKLAVVQVKCVCGEGRVRTTRGASLSQEQADLKNLGVKHVIWTDNVTFGNGYNSPADEGYVLAIGLTTGQVYSNLGNQYGKIKAVVFFEAEGYTAGRHQFMLLQHGTFRLMQKVWKDGGNVYYCTDVEQARRLLDGVAVV